MTKSLFLLVFGLLAGSVLCEVEPQKGGAEQRPGNKATNKIMFSSIFKVALLPELARAILAYLKTSAPRFEICSLYYGLQWQPTQRSNVGRVRSSRQNFRSIKS